MKDLARKGPAGPALKRQAGMPNGTDRRGGDGAVSMASAARRTGVCADPAVAAAAPARGVCGHGRITPAREARFERWHCNEAARDRHCVFPYGGPVLALDESFASLTAGSSRFR